MSAAAPLRVWLDPRLVAEHYLRRSSWEKLRFGAIRLSLPAHLQAGSWDRRTVPCEQHPTYALLADLHAAGLAVERTQLYAELAAAAARGQPQRRRGMILDDDAAIQHFFEDYVALYESIATHGYRAGMGKDEPGVAIGRGGTVIKVANGNHRFAVARLLEIPVIPVEVHFLHWQWYRATSRGPERLWRAVQRAPAIYEARLGSVSCCRHAR